MTKDDTKDIPLLLPCVEIDDSIIFPKMGATLLFNQIKDKELLNYMSENKEKVYIVVVKEGKNETYGTVCKYIERYDSPDGTTRVLLSGVQRCVLTSDARPSRDYDFYITNFKVIKDIGINDELNKTLIENEVLPLFNKIVALDRVSRDILTTIQAYRKKPGAVCDIIINALNLSLENKYDVLKSSNIRERIQLTLKNLHEYMEILKLSREIADTTRESLEKKNQEYYLREELKTINKKLDEVSEGGEEKSDTQLYEEKIKEKDLPEEALKEATNELKRMKRMHPASHEYSVISTYLDWMIDLPWNTSTEDILDIVQAREKLDNDHYGLEKPKKRILEYLAIRELNPKSRSPILCFSGPPGTGKTSIGRSIADAMGREFQRMSLGGVRDEAVIRGFKRTYVGSMPGRIIQAMKRAGTNNPVIMLDEVDKLGADHKGDPSSALLEALDPEQNHAFNDHYLNVSFDLSNVIFIATANLLEMIPPALRDRMEVINFPGYSQDEKEKIARQFLIPKQLKEHGLTDLIFTRYALDSIINEYTRETGVRNLEREIANVIRGAGCAYVETGKLTKNIGKKLVNKYLGIPKYPTKDDITVLRAGIAIGMYYSSVGGGITFYETVAMERRGKYPNLTMSGHLRDVMKESITVAMSWIRGNKRNINKLVGKTCNCDNSDVHVHVPEGATPKDGPSGGIAILVALVSLFSDVIPKDVTAYTGEITLSGKVLPVGGIKEKVLGAHRAGIKNIVMPSWCENNLDKIPKDIKSHINFHFVDTMEDVLKIAFKGE